MSNETDEFYSSWLKEWKGHCGYCYEGKPYPPNPDDPDSFQCCQPNIFYFRRWLPLIEINERRN